MANLLSLDFVAPNGTSLPTKDAQWGWRPNPAPGWAGNARIESNRVYGDAWDVAAFVYNQPISSADYEISSVVARLSDHNVAVKLLARIAGVDAAFAAYTATIGGSGATGTVSISKWEAGVESVLGSGTFTLHAVGTSEVFKFRLVGDNLSVRVGANLSPVLSVTDNTITSGGRTGVAATGVGVFGLAIETMEVDDIDVVAPTLSSASVSVTGNDTATGTVTTNESGGTLYYLLSEAATATASQVKSGSTSSVTSAGAKSVNLVGLASGTPYRVHFLHADASGNESAVLTTAPFTIYFDDEEPTLGGPISSTARTSSSLSVACPAGADNIGVLGYEWSSDGGLSWVDGEATHQFTGLIALTTYAIRVRAYDAAGNRSTAVSANISTFRAGAMGSTILLTTGPIDGNPAGIMYPFVQAGDESKWFSFRILVQPTTGTLTINPEGTFTFIGPQVETMSVQLEVDGADFGSPFSVTLYDQTADTQAPTLSSAVVTTVGSSTASGTVTTNESGGVLYYLASTNATESAASVKAAVYQVVTAAGVKVFSVSGLVPATTYYAHLLHRDAAGNDSTVVSTAAFTTNQASQTPALSGVGTWYLKLLRKYTV